MVFPGLIVVLSIILSFQIHHFLDFVKQIYKDLPKVVVSTYCIMFFFFFFFYRRQPFLCLSPFPNTSV